MSILLVSKTSQPLTKLVLDDNTYTNKTWAEVSGISVGEIHVMEVEFLSNMRYSLLASKEQWKEWHVKLGRFWEYFEQAARVAFGITIPIGCQPSICPTLTGCFSGSFTPGFDHVSSQLRSVQLQPAVACKCCQPSGSAATFDARPCTGAKSPAFLSETQLR